MIEDACGQGKVIRRLFRHGDRNGYLVSRIIISNGRVLSFADVLGCVTEGGNPDRACLLVGAQRLEERLSLSIGGIARGLTDAVAHRDDPTTVL